MPAGPAQEPDKGVAQPRQHRFDVVIARVERKHLLGLRLAFLLDDCLEQRFLAVEIDVERALGDAGLPRDLAHACAVEALPQEPPQVLGVESETNFDISPTYPMGHFGTLQQLLLDAHLLTFDISYNRVPRASFVRALASKGRTDRAALADLGKPATLNVLFCRDLIAEADHQENYSTPCEPSGVGQLIKMMIIYELYGLNDIALDTAERFAELLGSRFDVDHAIRLLANPDCRPGGTGHEELRKHIYDMEHSTSWRVTAPLRAAKEVFTALRLR